MTKKKTAGLIYIGKGFVSGIPARNLTSDEVEKYGKEALLATGIYTEPEKRSKAGR